MAGPYLNEANVDDLARMLMALLSEVWIMRDRMAVMETLLAEKAGISAEMIDNYVPDAAMAARLETLRDRLVGNVVTAPLAAQDRSVEAILRRAGFAEAAERFARAPQTQPG